jgi:hypothetical protein
MAARAFGAGGISGWSKNQRLHWEGGSLPSRMAAVETPAAGLSFVFRGNPENAAVRQKLACDVVYKVASENFRAGRTRREH